MPNITFGLYFFKKLNQTILAIYGDFKYYFFKHRIGNNENMTKIVTFDNKCHPCVRYIINIAIYTTI